MSIFCLFWQLNLDQPLSAQGPFDLILHKLTDIMAAASAGDEWSREAEQRVEVCLCVSEKDER